MSSASHRPRPRCLPRTLAAAALVAAGLPTACASTWGSADPVFGELQAISGPWTTTHPDTFRSILDHALAADAFVCIPSAKQVFHGPASEGVTLISGTMPHYDFYHGPMRYTVTRLPNRWLVSVKLAVLPPARDAVLELPDCELRGQLEGPVECSGIPLSQAPGVDACPNVGTFSAQATQHNVAALLRRWSTEAEAYYNRDAALFGIPVTYDFEFVESGGASAEGDAHDTLPLWTTCGRTPYFEAFRSGWSLPVVSHEIGHYLGLLDEYEMFSGIVGFYPKTPFPGAEVSRMGLSMKETTRYLPVHHYLVLRRAFCPRPASKNPYERIWR